MKKMKQKEIKNLISAGRAINVSEWNFEEVAKLNVICIGESFGKYGVNGGLYEDYESGEWYAVIGRFASLFQLV